MIRKMLAIGYEQSEFEKIRQCFMAMDQSIELVCADSLSTAASMLQSDYFNCMIARHEFLDHLPFINFLRSAEAIPILLLTCDKVCAAAPDIGSVPIGTKPTSRWIMAKTLNVKRCSSL